FLNHLVFFPPSKKYKIDNTLIFNGWKNAYFQEILKNILITSKGKVLVYSPKDISVKDASTKAVSAVVYFTDSRHSH
ncbi:26203_t:CDS:2, partial [Dentiscutata erythropus]